MNQQQLKLKSKARVAARAAWAEFTRVAAPTLKLFRRGVIAEITPGLTASRAREVARKRLRKRGGRRVLSIIDGAQQLLALAPAAAEWRDHCYAGARARARRNRVQRNRASGARMRNRAQLEELLRERRINGLTRSLLNVWAHQDVTEVKFVKSWNSTGVDVAEEIIWPYGGAHKRRSATHHKLTVRAQFKYDRDLPGGARDPEGIVTLAAEREQWPAGASGVQAAARARGIEVWRARWAAPGHKCIDVRDGVIAVTPETFSVERGGGAAPIDPQVVHVHAPRGGGSIYDRAAADAITRLDQSEALERERLAEDALADARSRVWKARRARARWNALIARSPLEINRPAIIDLVDDGILPPALAELRITPQHAADCGYCDDGVRAWRVRARLTRRNSATAREIVAAAKAGAGDLIRCGAVIAASAGIRK